MPLFSILRNLPGAGQDEIDAAAFRALSCAFEYPGLRWVHSYWDREGGFLTCIYEARDREQIEEHSRRSRIPCDDVREVLCIQPGDYFAGEATAVEAAITATP